MNAAGNGAEPDDLAELPRPTAAPRRGAARPTPERNADFDHLGLVTLRNYRTALGTEEARVSYWRRVMLSRLDLVRSVEEGTTKPVDVLRDVIGGLPVQSSRSALLDVMRTGDIPPLPALAELWGREPRPGDSAANVELILALEEAERRLSDYRAAVIKRLEDCTAELIARYRQEPDSCLVALPSRR